MDSLYLAARIIFGGFFLYKGVRHFMNPGTAAGTGGGRRAWFPAILWGMTGLTLVLGGLCFVFGFHPLYGIVWSGSVVSHSWRLFSQPGT